MIMIAFKGAIRNFFYNLLAALRITVSNTYAQVAKAQMCAYHVQHIKRLSRAKCRVLLGMKGQLAQLLSFERVEIAFTLALPYWLKPLTDVVVVVVCFCFALLVFFLFFFLGGGGGDGRRVTFMMLLFVSIVSFC